MDILHSYRRTSDPMGIYCTQTKGFRYMGSNREACKIYMNYIFNR